MAQTPPAQPKLDVSQLLAGIPTGSSAGTADFIGLPVNTSDPGAVMALDQAAQGQWAQGKPAAAYANGAQMMPVYQSWHPEDIDNLQRRLVSTGLLDQDYQKGVWDQTSQKAFEPILAMANNMGRPWQDALAQYETGSPMVWDAKTGTFTPGKPGTGRTRTPVVTRFTAPDDLAAAAQEIATSKLGRSFSPDELQRFVRAYHGQESAEATGQNAAQTGGSYTAASSPAVAADTFAKQVDPTAYNAEQFLPLVQKMNDLLAGPTLATTKPMSA
jgi:hypothetical protein